MPDAQSTEEIDLLALLQEQLASAVPPLEKLGIGLVELSAGRAVSHIPIDGNRNHFGAMYAGSLFCVGEMLAGALFVPLFDLTTHYPTVKNLSIDFRRPATTDVQATAELDEAQIARLRHELETDGRSRFALVVHLTDAANEVVAEMRGDCHIRSHSTT